MSFCLGNILCLPTDNFLVLRSERVMESPHKTKQLDLTGRAQGEMYPFCHQLCGVPVPKSILRSGLLSKRLSVLDGSHWGPGKDVLTQLVSEGLELGAGLSMPNPALLSQHRGAVSRIKYTWLRDFWWHCHLG